MDIRWNTHADRTLSQIDEVKRACRLGLRIMALVELVLRHRKRAYDALRSSFRAASTKEAFGLFANANRLSAGAPRVKLSGGRGHPVMHWFAGTVTEAPPGAELDYDFSVNSEIIRSPKHRQPLPLDRILIEPDGPLSKSNGRPVRSVAVAQTMTDVAALRYATQENMGATIISNLRALVGEQGSRTPRHDQINPSFR